MNKMKVILSFIFLVSFFTCFPNTEQVIAIEPLMIKAQWLRDQVEGLWKIQGKLELKEKKQTAWERLSEIDRDLPSKLNKLVLKLIKKKLDELGILTQEIELRGNFKSS